MPRKNTSSASKKAHKPRASKPTGGPPPLPPNQPGEPRSFLSLSSSSSEAEVPDTFYDIKEESTAATNDSQEPEPSYPSYRRKVEELSEEEIKFWQLRLNNTVNTLTPQGLAKLVNNDPVSAIYCYLTYTLEAFASLAFTYIDG